jgi:hypothetical protein
MVRRRKKRKYQLNARWTFDQSVLSGVGLYVTLWAGVERMLNHFIVAYHPHRPPKLKTLPRDLMFKVKYLSEVAKDERLPEQLRQHIAEIAADLGRESDYRHNLIHGYGFRRRQLGNLNWTFQWIDLRGKEPKLVEETYSHEEMRRRLQRISEISHRAAGVLTPIFFPQMSSVSRP